MCCCVVSDGRNLHASYSCGAWAQKKKNVLFVIGVNSNGSREALCA